MKLSHINGQLENLFNKADIQETLTPGSAVLLLPSGKELSRLACLAGELCALRKKSCKCAIKTLSRGRSVEQKKAKLPKTGSGSKEELEALAEIFGAL